MGDDGAGIHTTRILENRLKNRPVDIIDGGTPGMSLLYRMESRKKIIFIDSGRCGLRPGEYARFLPQEVNSKKRLPGLSGHEFDLIAFLQWASEMVPLTQTEIVIYCIQPGEIKITTDLSPRVRQTVPFLAQEVYNEVNRDLKNV
jgi:hydrogenase maturation protease